jgi:hypothetical protein
MDWSLRKSCCGHSSHRLVWTVMPNMCVRADTAATPCALSSSGIEGPLQEWMVSLLNARYNMVSVLKADAASHALLTRRRRQIRSLHCLPAAI